MDQAYAMSFPGGAWGVGIALYLSLWLLSAGAAALFVLVRRAQWIRGIGLYAGSGLLAVFLLTAPIQVSPPAPWAFRLRLYWTNLMEVAGFSALLLGVGGVVGYFAFRRRQP